LSCTVDGKFINPYDIEFYTEYDAANKPLVTVRFRLLGTAEVNKVQLIYTSDGGFISSLLNIRTRAMEKGPDGWYSTTFSNLGNTQMIDGKGMYFAVMVSPAKRCSYLLNYYTTKSISYTVGVGCQDETKFSIIKFTKTYDRQSEFTLQTNGRMASVGVFPEDAYHPEVESEFENEKFDIDKRLFYNNFDDAPSKFTLDISDYKVGTYYLHIHDVYGEAGDLKYLWAIY
jgi:hypothetical protein